jgi:hypothetical protein
MFLFFLFLDLQYEKLYQILGELKYKPPDVQKIKINVDIKLGLPLQQDQKMMYLNFDLLII